MNVLNEIHQKQVSNKIFIALLVLLAAGIAAYWWFSNRQHPYINADKAPLCKILPQPQDGAECADNDSSSSVAAHSVYSVKGLTVLTVDLITTKNISVPEPMSTQLWLTNATPEIKASGRQDIAEPVGPWTSALITRNQKQQELLFEDNGVIVVMQSDVLDRNALLAYATRASKALRGAKPIASSPAAATPQS
jgi:hypothetical protein